MKDASRNILAEAPAEAILEAAATVFAEHGYAGARVEAIAQAAGLNKAMLYYRVGDKARLYELVVSRLFARVAGLVEAHAHDTRPPVDILSDVLAAVAALFDHDPRLPRIMAWELASGGGNLPEAVAGHWGRILGVVAPLAKRLGLDPVLTYFSLLGPMAFICLTGPVRKRLGGRFPAGLEQAATVGPSEMAGFLVQMMRNTAREVP